MDSLNFIFGLRAVNTTGTEDKPFIRDYGIFNSIQESAQKASFFNEEDLKEEDINYHSPKEQEIHEVIF